MSLVLWDAVQLQQPRGSPVVGSAVERVSDPRDVHAEHAGQGATIAIVDDNDRVRRALARLVGTFGYRVKTFPSGPDFLESLNVEAPDCLLLDLQMPGMTGLEVLTRLSGAGFTFPTIVVTAHDDLGMQHRCQLAGARAFFVKPVTKQALLTALAAALGETRHAGATGGKAPKNNR